MKRPLHLALTLAATSITLGACSRAHDTGTPGPEVTAADLDVRGTWLPCGGSLVIAPDGVATYASELHHCEVRGRWSIAGDQLTLTWDPDGTCEMAGTTTTQRASIEGPLLTLRSDGESRPSEFLREGALSRERWRAEGAERELAIEGTAYFELHGTIGEGLGRGCYWSAGDCDGVLSCGGQVSVWEHDDESGVLHAETTCGGDCACAATIEGREQPDGLLDATFHATNCRREFDGTLTFHPDA